MICVPYIINGSYKVARLEGNQSAEPYYIKETESTDEIDLFEFEKALFAFDPNRGIENDYTFSIIEEKCKVASDKTNHTATITIAIECKNIAEAPSVTHLSFEKSGLTVEEGYKVFFDLREIDHNDDTVSTIIIKITEITEGLTYTFGINVAQKDNICDIVIDFGSEASQIWTYFRGNLNPWHEGNHMPLFENIKKDSDATIKSVANHDIYQFDNSNEKLYRSLFFIKKAIGNTITNNDLTFINKLDDLLTILGENIALPNLKLMEYGNVPLPQITVDNEVFNIFQLLRDIRPQILNFFFKKALENINERAGNNTIACKLIFLVPNTFRQEMLSDLLNDLIIDVNSHITDNPNNFSQIRHGIEVTTFSESDASFFGWYTPTFFLNNNEERILMVDIGKGTTDFSVLDVNNENGRIEVERIARSGLVGAGNVMTFAILATTYNSLAEKMGGCRLAEIIDAIKAIAYHNDPAKKSLLYGYLEQLKRHENLDGRQSLHDFIMSYPGRFTCLGAINIDGLNQMLASACTEKCYVDDNDSVVNEYAKILTNQLIDELKYVYDENIRLDRVVFSGRGAMSNPLRQEIEGTLREINNNIDTTILNNNNIKTGCLKGPLNGSLIMDHMNMAIVGWPQQIKPTKGKQAKTAKKKKWLEWFKWLERFKWLLDFFAEENFQTTEEIEELNNFIPRKVVSSDFATFSEYQGQILNIDVNNNLFILGNRRCHVPLFGENNLGGKHIYFDGEDFVVRDEEHSYRFEYHQNPSDICFITETFFPMTEGNPENVDMPALEEVLKSANPNIVDDHPTTEDQASSAINENEDFTVIKNNK